MDRTDQQSACNGKGHSRQTHSTEGSQIILPIPADVEISSPSKLVNQSVEKHQVFSQVNEPGEDDLFVCMQIIKG